MGWGRKADRVHQEKKQGKQKRGENKKDEGLTHPSSREGKLNPKLGQAHAIQTKKRKKKLKHKLRPTMIGFALHHANDLGPFPQISTRKKKWARLLKFPYKINKNKCWSYSLGTNYGL